MKILVDDAIDLESKEKLINYLEKWLDALIKKELSDLVNLSNPKSKTIKQKIQPNNNKQKKTTKHK